MRLHHFVPAVLALTLAFGAGAQGTPTDGEVLRVDPATQRITLKHGEIRSLDMPPMRMLYQVRDPAMLDKLRPGDKVRFTADKINGAYTVTSIEVVK